jgi:hypothetical protein
MPALPAPFSRDAQRSASLYAIRCNVAAKLLAGAFALLAGCHSPAPAPRPEPVPGDALADYLPADSAGVVQLSVRRLGRAPVFRKLPGARPLALLHRLQGPLELLGADLGRDVDELRVVFPAGAPGRPLLLARGRFDPGSFRTGPGALQEQSAGPGGRFVLYRYHSPQTGEMFFAHAPPFLLLGADRERLLVALSYALRPRPRAPRDGRLRRALAEVDRTQTLWLAVNLRRLGRVPPLPDTALELALRPILNSARLVSGGLTASDDLRAAFRCEAADKASADKVQSTLTDLREIAEVSDVFPGVGQDQRFFLRLLAAGAIRREGLVVTVRCRWAP